MVWDLASLALGLIAGLLTGFYFERRQTVTARAEHEETIRQNEELTRQLDELHRAMTVVSTGVRSRIVGTSSQYLPHEREGLRESLMKLAKGMQDAAGRVEISLLERNLSNKYTNKEIEDVTNKLEAERIIERKDGYLYILF